MKAIFVRKIGFGFGAFFFRAFWAILICSFFIFANELSIFGKEFSNTESKNHNLRSNKLISTDSQQTQSGVQEQLIKRSKQYLYSIENNQSFSPELKRRIKSQSQKIIQSGINNLSNPAAVRINSAQSANNKIDAAFFLNALNKLNATNQKNPSGNIYHNSNSNSNSNFNTNNALRALDFLSKHYRQNKNLHLPTNHEVALRVALPDNLEIVSRLRMQSLNNTNNRAPLNQIELGAIGCCEIIITQTQPRDPKSFAKLLEKNIKALEQIIQNYSNQLRLNPTENNIVATSVQIAKNIVLRN
ncbi:MAG: hypothetical protein LBP59_16745 [Planctomycetaceae bacterium]|jgi:hypothetical protein|nr:hypothetical protein [Planctomycetaceae bacterium]